MTEDEFWRAVGERLAEIRRRQKATASIVEENGGPTNKTMADIEAGNIGQLSKLQDYARALKVDLVDLFRSVLKVDDEQSEELQYVIRQFKRAGVTGRATIVQVAQLAEERSEPQPPASPVGRGAKPADTSRAGTGAAKRRGAK